MRTRCFSTSDPNSSNQGHFSPSLLNQCKGSAITSILPSLKARQGLETGIATTPKAPGVASAEAQTRVFMASHTHTCSWWGSAGSWGSALAPSPSTETTSTEAQISRGVPHSAGGCRATPQHCMHRLGAAHVHKARDGLSPPRNPEALQHASKSLPSQMRIKPGSLFP